MCNLVCHHYDNPTNVPIGNPSMARRPRTMQIGTFLGTSHLCHLICPLSGPDHPIGDQGKTYLP